MKKLVTHQATRRNRLFNYWLKLLGMILLCLSATTGWGQVSLTNGTPGATIDFSSSTLSTAGTNPGTAFSAAGFSPNPTIAGRLNSNAWAISGWSDGNLTFGGTNTTGDYARGAVNTAQTTGGIYAFTGSPGSSTNPSLMIQPGGSDWAPGTLTLRIVNNGTTNIIGLAVQYDIFIRNDQARSNSFNFSWSIDNVNYTSVAALDYTSIASADALGWVLVGSSPSRSTTLSSLNIAPGSYIYIRWSGSDVGGTGSRDEFGLDNISMNATFCTPPTLSSSVTNVTCPGGTNGAIDLTLTGGTGPFTYLWSNASTSEDPSGLSAGTYSVTVTATGGCTAELTGITVGTANANPNAGTISGSSAVCLGSTITLTSNGDAGGTWTSSDALTASVNSSGVVSGVAAGGPVTITYEVTNVCGTVSATKDVSVDEEPTLDLSASNSPVCAGEDANLIAALGGSATSLTWTTGGDGAFSDIHDPAAFYTPGSADITAGTVTLTATSNANGCPADVQNFVLTINPAPVVSASNDGPVCAGSSFTLDGTVTGGSGVYTSYTWTGVNNLNTYTTLDYTKPVSVASDDDTYILVVQDANGCSGVAQTVLTVNTPSTWYQDADLDGYHGAIQSSCGTPSGSGWLLVPGTNGGGDCNDNNAAVNPGATEVCNSIDDDCDASIDEGVTTTFYQDSDTDTYGNAAVTTQACSAPSGYVAIAGDCNDGNAAINPGATEICNNIDDDCDASIDEGVTSTFYADADADTYGNAAVTTQACSAPSGYVSNSTDCNDGNGAINPGATEVCNGVDDDCDGLTDEGVTSTFYADADGDTYGNAAVTTLACTAPLGYVSNSTDCNDGNGAVNPGATEVCNTIDDDCDGLTDEGLTSTFYADADGDTYGNAAVTTVACTAPSGYVSNNTDCNDASATVHPGATELCNGIDDDCDGLTDEGAGTVHNTTANTYHCTIQAAINAATAGDVISVPAGTYAEDITVNKSVSILGPNAGIDPCSGTRVAEAIVVPATADISMREIFHVAASNVTISGFTIDGDNTSITSGYTSTNGADIDAAEGVTVYETGVNNLTVSNNIIQNLSYFGVTLYDYPAGVPSSGHSINNNKIQNLGTYDATSGVDYWGGGVLLYNNQYTAVTNNCMSNVRLGLQTGNFYQANPGTSASQQISGNTIQARRTGVFHNLHYSNASALTFSNNTITALANANETKWDGIALSSLAIGSSCTNNTINGNNITVANGSKGYEVWNVAAPATNNTITGGSVSGVDMGVFANNYDGYSSNAPDGAYATVSNVTITPKVTGVGVRIYDNALATSHAPVRLSVSGCTISGAEGVRFEESQAGTVGGTISGNTINASAVGVNVNSMVTSGSNVFTLSNNNITLSSQIAGSNPTVGVSLRKLTGTSAAAISGNTISGAFYGYLGYNVNTSPVTEIDGGTISGVMQGVAFINVDPLSSSTYAASNSGVKNVSMSGFTGNYPSAPASNFHAGVYSFTGGSNTAATLTLNIKEVSISGTGKNSQSSAAIYPADFSTGAGVRQTITIDSVTLSNNLNRGISARGANAVIDVNNSTLTNNGGDPYGLGGNDGFGIIAREACNLTVDNSFITNPASNVGYSVYALATDPGTAGSVTLTATNNSINNNGNASGKLAGEFGGTLDATCNWWGTGNLATIASGMVGGVTYQPMLTGGTDNDAVMDGFQPSASCAMVVAVSVSGTATDETCSNLNDGTIDITAAGGIAPYTYAWSNSASTEDLSGLDAGIYTVTVTDAYGNSGTSSFTVGTAATATTWYADTDADTYGDLNTTTLACTQPSGYVANSTDCNDGNAAINPGATEVCNGIDDDCDGTADDGLTFLMYYTDADGDGYGSYSATGVSSCSPISGSVTNNTDCNDAVGTINPGAPELCNGIDDNCNLSADEGLTFTTYYFDQDNDTYGYGPIQTSTCNGAPSGYVAIAGDCNDNNNQIYPGAAEVCNGIDDDCDFSTDEGLTFTTYYFDQDNDTYGYGPIQTSTCNGAPSGYVAIAGDCNDNNAAINPGAAEVCNGIDDDCDFSTDEGLTFTTYYFDQDNDTYGYGPIQTSTCNGAPSGYVAIAGDCNDNNAAINPGATEVCNGIDDNCDFSVDEGMGPYTLTPSASGNGTVSPSITQVVSCLGNQTFTFTADPGYMVGDVLVNGISVGAPSSYTFSNVAANATIDVTFVLAGCANPPTIFAGTDIHTCITGDATFSALLGGGATSVVSWTGGLGTYSYPNFPDLSVLVYTPDPSEAGTVVTLVATTDDPDGVGPCVAASDDVQITVDEEVTVDAGADIRVCSVGGIVNLNGIVSGGASAGIWSGGLGSFSPNANSLAVQYIPDGSESGTVVTLTLTPDMGTNVCPVIPDDVSITVDAEPLANAGADLIVCDGGSIALNGSVTNVAGGIWSGGLGTFTPSNTDLNATYTPDPSEVNTVVTLTLTTTDPLNVCPAGTDDVDITVNEVIVNAGPDIHVCEDGFVGLSGIISGGASTGVWSGGLGTFSPSNTDLNATYTPDPSEAGTVVTLTLTSDAGIGCPSSTDQIDITIDQLATVNAGPSINTCVDGTANLNGIVGGGAVGGIWSGGIGTFSPSNTSLNVIYTPDLSEVNSTVTLTLTAVMGAGNVCPVPSDQLDLIIEDIPSAAAGMDQSICFGGSVSLNGSLAGGAVTATWTTSGDGTFNNANALNAVYTPGPNDLLNGNVWLTLTPDPTGVCYVLSDDVFITFFQSLTLTVTGTDVTCTGANDGTASANVVGGLAPIDYLWNTGAITAGISSLSPGTYTVTVTDANGCFLSDDVTISTTVDVTDPVTPVLAALTGECSVTATAPTTTDNCVGTVTGTTTDPLTYTTQGTYTINWTFDDGNGNSIVVPQSVIVDDVTNPATPVLAALTGECSVTATAPTTTDNCVGTVTGTTTDPLTYTTQGTYTINWTFDDGNGNSIVVPQSVIVDDVTNPATPVLAALTGECSVTATAPTTTDNCVGTVTGTTTDPLTYTTQGTYTINWTFDDGNGNSIVVPQSVIVDDVTNPATPVLAALTGECSVTATAPTTTDNCVGTVTGTTTDPLTYTTQGTYTINWTFDDGNGNSIVVPQSVIVDDVTNPATPVLAALTGECSVTATAPTTTDNCVGTVTGTTTDPLTYTTQGTYTINWTFDDGNGNSIVVPQSVIVDDVTNPATPVLAALTGECSVTATAPTTTDNCVGTVTGTTTDPLTYTTQGTYTINWTFDDGNGNSIVVPQSVIVDDVTNPATPVLAALTGECSVTATAPTTTDNCVGTVTGTTTDPLTYTTQGTYTINWTFDDGNGNSIVVPQSVIVDDVTNPATPVLAALTGECSVTATAPTTTDNCVGTVTGTTTDPLTYTTQGTYTINWTFDDGNGNSIVVPQSVIVDDVTNPATPVLAALTGECSVTATAPTTTDNCVGTVTGTTTDPLTYTTQGTYTINWTFDDGNGNSIVVPQSVIVDDVTNPATPVLAALTGECSVTATAPTTTDNCVGTVTGTTTDPLTYTTQGTYTINWTFDDGNGNSIVVPQSVIVDDVTNPATPVLAALTGECSVTATAPTTTDNCVGTVTGTTTDPLTYTTQGTYTINWTFDDGNGNSIVVPQSVIVDDVTNPATPVLAALTGECSVTATAPTTTDNCVGTVTGTTTDPLTYTTQGTYTINWTFDDGNGNSIVVPQSVIVDDVTNPATPVLAALTGECSVTATAPTTTDNCVGTVTGTTTDPLTYTTQGTYTINWTFDDGNGNSIVVPQSVIVDDVTNPAFSGCPGNITQCGSVVTWTPPVASDNCSGFSVSSNYSPGASFPVGTTTVTYTVTDVGGNTATCSFDVTITPTPIWYADADGDTYGDPSTSQAACTQPSGYVADNTDCNDNNAAVNPAATEICNNIDDDCDGLTDSNDPSVVGQSTWYADVDGDSYGNAGSTTLACYQPSGYVFDNSDCNDNNAAVNPAATEVCNGIDDDCDGDTDDNDQNVTGQATWYADADGDTYGDAAISQLACSQPSGYVADNTDCDDADASINPGATEVCNGIDDDCDGTADDGITYTNYYVDGDGDGYGAGPASYLCYNPGAGYATLDGDCNDANSAINPGATEICNNIDDDCDGLTDSNDPSVVGQSTWYADADGDTYGNAAVSTLACFQPSGYVFDNSDCNDNNAAVNPAATEVCNGIDDDCDGDTDDNDQNVTGQATWYADADGDTYGDAAISQLACSQPSGYVADNTDCDDADAAINPGATEVCNGIDDDCDGTADDGITYTNYYVDGDGDGYGAGPASYLCYNPGAGYATLDGDCNDAISAINPGAQEICDGIDNDCDGLLDNNDPSNLDVTAPVADVAVLPTVTGECSATVSTSPTATDNCVGVVTGTTTDPLTYTSQGTYTITWTYDDGNGNTSIQTQTVIVDDVTNPATPVLAALTGECSVTATAPTTTDNCVGTVTGTTTDPLTYTAQGTYTINWTFDDGNGNSIVVPQSVIVDDVTNPATPVLAALTGECSVTATAPTTTDNCVGTVTGTTTDPLTYTTQGTYTINWTFDDGNGNSIIVPQSVIVDDVTNPATPVLAALTGECSVTATAPTTTDNCVGTVTGTTTDPLTYTTQGTYTINWTFDDGNGNSIVVPQSVIVDDVTNPATPVLAALTGECSVTATAPTTTDNCVGTVTGTTTDPLTYTAQGTYTINWTFDDGNGNSIVVPQSVIVDDVTNPATPVLAALTGECSVTATAPTTTDNCVGTVTGTTTDPLTYTTQGTYTINWTFDDGNGNSIVVPQSVIVDDVTNPATPVLAALTGECSVTATAPTTTDNCVGTVTGTTTDPLTYTTQGTYTINWTFDDGNGNSIVVPQSVIVDDVTNPATPVLAALTGECSVTATAPTTTDNCVGTVTGTTTDPLTYTTQGTYTINWTFDDGNGNSIVVPQSVIVDDVTNPATPVLAALTGECSVTATAPTTTDNCVGTVTGTTTDPLTYTAQGTYTINWTFNDGNGNSIVVPQSVIVDDVTNPAFSGCPGNITQCGSVVTWTPPVASDNCSGFSVSSNYSPGASFPVGTTTVTYTVTDIGGNIATCSFTVTITPTPTWYLDADADGYYTGTPVTQCTSPGAGYTTSVGNGGGDCNDGNANINPGMTEVCGNGIDDNCDGNIDEFCTTYTFYADADGDSYGNAAVFVTLFTPVAPSGYVSDNTDCNDASNTIYPGAPELCNGVDDDCDGLIDDGLTSLPTPGAITGQFSGCVPATYGSASYSVPVVPGASNYTWNVPAGFTILSGQGTNSITVQWTNIAVHNGIVGQICVGASGTCGSSALSCSNIEYEIAIPVTPNSISGPGKICPGETATYSISPVFRATSYNWNLPTGMTLLTGAGTNVITVAVNGSYTGGTISVSGTNVCGTGVARTKTLSLNTPLTPTVINGQRYGLCNATGVVFSTPAVANATSYTWTVVGGTITAGQGTTSITVDIGLLSGTGTVSVVAVNNCGPGLARSTNIFGVPDRAQPITGNNAVCTGTIEPYSVSTVAGAVTYTWTVSAGGSINSGQGSKNITILWGASPASNQAITVTTSNACGNSTIRSQNGYNVSSCPRIADENSNVSNVMVYPNPATDLITLNFDAKEEGDYQVRITDMAGRLVFNEQGAAVAGNNRRDIAVDQFTSGVYFVTLENAGQTQVIRLMVE